MERVCKAYNSIGSENVLKAYKYKLEPTVEQKILIEKHIGSCRYIYNWALSLKVKSYEETGKSLSHIHGHSKL